MAQAERAKENKNDSRRERAKVGRSKRATGASGISYRDIGWIPLVALTVAFAEAGGAIRLGYTRDGGALAIGCYLGDDYATEYIRPSEDFDSAVLEIAEAWLPEKGVNYHQALQELTRGADKR